MTKFKVRIYVNIELFVLLRAMCVTIVSIVSLTRASEINYFAINMRKQGDSIRINTTRFLSLELPRNYYPVIAAISR